MKRKLNIHIYYYITIIYMFISFVLGIILSNGLIVFLGWNIFLATVVFLLSQIIHRQYNQNMKKILWIGLIILYILFFPNTFYVLTDFIHFQNYTYFTSYPDVYAFKVYDWLVFMHIVIGALYAAKLGVTSLTNIEVIFDKYSKKTKYAVFSALFVLSSLGIFIGRFLRFNSWDILNMFHIVLSLFNQDTFLFMFISIFFIIHWVSYFIFKYNPNNNLKQTNNI